MTSTGAVEGDLLHFFSPLKFIFYLLGNGTLKIGVTRSEALIRLKHVLFCQYVPNKYRLL